MWEIIESSLLEIDLPCAVYWNTDGYRYSLWYQGKEGAPELPTHILWNIDDSSWPALIGQVTAIALGEEFGPIPEKTVNVGIKFVPSEITSYTGTFTTESSAEEEASVSLSGDWIITTVYVKKDAAGNCDGMDWDNAFNSLQEGMDFAHDYGIPNVLVAQGSYRPERCEDITGGPRFNTFILHNNVRVICGYSGIGYDRDRDAYPTILSGDMGDYNVYNVIRIPSDAGLDNTCILEDAIISGGRAEGSPKYPQTLTGGGIFVQSGNECMFLRCIVRDNTAVLGGGIHITGYSSTMISELLGDPDPMAPLPEPSENPDPVDDTLLPYLEGCIFTENTARLGGGIYLSGINAASPIFTACGATFNNAVYGGGLMADSCGGELCLGMDYSLTPYGQTPGMQILYNKASMCGGGLFLYRSTMGCKYVLARSNNALKTGGGLLMSSLTGNTIQYCMFDSNSSPIGGGAAFTSGIVEMSDTFMVGNTAARTGAGVSSSGGAVLIDRCFFKANLMVDSARNDKSGGALSSLYSRMSVYNSYFTGNRANLGSVVYTDKGSIGLTGVTVEGNIEDHRSACFHAKGTTLAVIASVILNSNLQDGVPCGGFPGNITGQDLALSADADTGWVTGTAITGDPDMVVAVLTYPWDEGYSEILVPDSGSPLKGVVNIAVFDGYDTDLTETLRSDPASIGAVD